MSKGNKMVKKWVKEMKYMLQRTYPNATEKEIKEYLTHVLNKYYNNEEVKVYNNYENTVKLSTMADMEDFYYSDHKPIATEHGTFFRNGPDNPAVLMLLSQKAERKEMKKARDKCDKNSEDYAKFDLYQSLKKISMNSYYGASGAPTSIFFNIHCATAITGKGQAIISTATQAFESFLSNNSVFTSDDECIVFIKNCIKDSAKSNILNYIDRMPTLEEALYKLQDTYEYPESCNLDVIYDVLRNLTDKEIATIYYKNNLYEFINDSAMMRDYIKTIVLGCDNFVDPNMPPEHMVDTLDASWELLRDCVYYNYMITDKVYRLKNKRRKSVMIIDTDSNMINMHPWACMVRELILADVEHDKSYNEIRYNALSTIAYYLSKMIRSTYDKFMKHSNVPKEKWEWLRMKNEYLYKRMLISDGKKNYVGLVEYKEGKWMDYELDVKGLPIDKISSNQHASKFFKDLVKYDILKNEEIDIPLILRKLQDFQDNIIKSLSAGEVTYLKPSRVKESKYYADPLGQQAVRATYHWNELDPFVEIEPPDSVYIAKLKASKLSDLEIIRDKFPDKYELVKEKIFNSDIETIRSKGLYVIALPRTEDKVPDWLIPLIDVDTIVEDTMKNIVKILKSLDLFPIGTTKSQQHFGNIVKL